MAKERNVEVDSQEATDPVKDEHAYEDSWYRSLKAMAQSRGTVDEEDEPAEPAEG